MKAFLTNSTSLAVRQPTPRPWWVLSALLLFWIVGPSHSFAQRPRLPARPNSQRSFQASPYPSDPPSDRPTSSDDRAGKKGEIRSCDSLGPLDPSRSIVNWLDEVRLSIDPSTPCRLEETVQGTTIRSRYSGAQISNWLELAEAFVEENPIILTLRPLGPQRIDVRAQVSTLGQHGIRWVGPTKIEVTGSTRSGDSLARLQNLLHLAQIDPQQGFFEAQTRQILDTLGYVGHWSWNATGSLILVVHPGHLIRKIRTRGIFPVKRRDVLSQIPSKALPGSLSPMRCLPRSKQHELLSCADGDLRCERWRADVRERVETVFVERGYLKAHAELALICERNTRQATLEIKVSKNGLYRVDPKRIRFLGKAADLPKVFKRQVKNAVSGIALPGDEHILSSPATQLRMDEMAAKLRRGLSEPGRAFGTYFRPGQRPYPSARFKLLLNLREPTPDRKVALDVHAQLGPPLALQFMPRGGDARKLEFNDAQLQRQLQLFSREESPSQLVADNEAANLRAFYQSKAFPLATVRGSFTDFESLERLAFEIDEGPSARIQSVRVKAPREVPAHLAEFIEREWQRERALSKRDAFTDAKALEDLGRLSEAYRAKGYPCASARLRLAFWPKGLEVPGAHATLSASSLLQGGGTPSWLSHFDPNGLAAIRKQARGNIHLLYEVQAGPRLLAKGKPIVHYLARPPRLEPATQIPARSTGQWSARRILYRTSLRPNGEGDLALPVHSELQRSATADIARKYHAAGYPMAHASVFWGVRSTPEESWSLVRELRELADPKSGICHGQEVGKTLEARPEIFVYEGKRGKFGDTVFRGNFKTRTRSLERELDYRAGDRYGIDRLENTLRSLETLGIFNRLEVTPMPNDCESDSEGDCVVHHAIEVQESADYFMDLRYGLGAATLNPLYVFLQPTIPNIAGSGWRLGLDLSWGFDVVENQLDSRLAICGGADCYERRASATLSRPHLPGMRVGVNLGTQLQIRKTPARGFVSTINATARLTWTLSRGRYFYTGYRFQRANISEDIVKPLGGSTGDWVNRSLATVRDNTGMLEGGVQIRRVDNPFNPDEGYIANADIAIASRYLGGGDHWAKIDLSWQHFVPLRFLSDRWQFRYALRYGQIFPFSWAGTITAPKIWRYYGGGSFDLGLRGMRPETMLLDLERIPTPSGGAILRAKAQGGHLRLLSTLALEYASVRDLFGGTLSHSVFYDSGYLLQSFVGADLRRDYRHSIGLNFIKLDINLASLALGYALLLPPNVTEYDDRNGRFVFDVGITF